MDVIVGIDVSKDRLDVHVLPAGDSFLVGNDHAGVDGLITRLREAKADVVALEATGGYEMLAAAGLSSAGALPLSWSIRRRFVPMPMRWANVPRPTRSTRR